jgi:hypothetical protein
MKEKKQKHACYMVTTKKSKPRPKVLVKERRRRKKIEIK